MAVALGGDGGELGGATGSHERGRNKVGKGEVAMTEGVREGESVVLRGFCRPYLHGNHMRRARASAVQE